MVAQCDGIVRHIPSIWVHPKDCSCRYTHTRIVIASHGQLQNLIVNIMTSAQFGISLLYDDKWKHVVYSYYWNYMITFYDDAAD